MMKRTILSPKRRMPDNFIFYLHYRFTVLLLVTFGLIVTCRLFVGHSFRCRINTSSRSSLQFVETKCYDETVFSLPAELISDNKDADTKLENFKRYQSYYPWVNLLFFVHAFNFYLPRFLWKSYESGYMSKLTIGLEGLGSKEEKRGLELTYLARHILATQGKHRLYTSMFIFCEACNFAMSLSHTLWLIFFFNVTGVPDFLPFEIKTWVDFRQFYFPPLGTCIYEEKGVSGTLMKFTTSCLLPLNHLYMFMFIVIRAWYILLTILAGAILVYRIVLLVPSLRMNVTTFHAPISEKTMLKSLCCRLSYSDWFFSTRFQSILTDIDFAHLLKKIAVISECKGFENEHNIDDILSLREEIHKEPDSTNTTSQL